MKIEFSMTSELYSFHNFTKSNLVSNVDGSDTYCCEDCGVSLKRPAFRDVLRGNVSAKKLYTCTHGENDRAFGGTTKVHKKGLTVAGVCVFNEQTVKIPKIGQIPTSLEEKDLAGKTFKTVPFPNGWQETKGAVCVILPTSKRPIGEVIKLLDGEFEIVK